jgi:hypothetical protein
VRWQIEQHYDVKMPKTKTTVYVDEDVLRSARVFAARKDLKDSEVIERALRQFLGMDLLERIWSDNTDLDADEALAMAGEEVRAHRAGR